MLIGGGRCIGKVKGIKDFLVDYASSFVGFYSIICISNAVIKLATWNGKLFERIYVTLGTETFLSDSITLPCLILKSFNGEVNFSTSELLP